MRNTSSRAIQTVMAASLAILGVRPLAGQTPVVIERISVIEGANGPQIEIASTGQTNPQTQLVHDPDRIVVDFPNTIPSRSLRKIAVERGEVLSVRAGQYSTNPPVTRVVIDLKSPIAYELVPAGKFVMVKLGVQPAARVEVPATDDIPDALPPPRLQVSFNNGLLSIRADKATFAEVLDEVHRKVGTVIAFTSSNDNGAGAQQIAAQDKVYTDLGPASAREVLTSLLDGSRFNFVMMGSERSASDVRSIVLSARTGSGFSQPTGNYVPPSQAVRSAPTPGAAAGPGVFDQPNQQPEEQAPVELPEQEQPMSGSPPTQ